MEALAIEAPGSASLRQRRAARIVMAVALVMLLPAFLASNVVLPAAPGVVVFCIGVITVVQALAAVLFYDHAAMSGERSYLYIAAGSQFVAIMGPAWALTTPDTLQPGAPLLGTPAVGVFTRLSLALVYCLCLGLAAVAYRSDHPHYPREPGPERVPPARLVARTAVGVTVVALVWVGGLILLADALPPLVATGGTSGTYPASWWAVVALIGLSVLMVLPSYLTNSVLHGWVLMTLVLIGAAIICGLASETRYSLSWYATYLYLMLGAVALLGLVLVELRNADLRRRTAMVELEASASATRHALTTQAATDPLTGLPNRAHFFSGVRARIQGYLAGDPRRRLAVIVADCDGFKGINDRWGHSTGDHVLAELARRMRLHTRSADLVCRLGGDEFGLAFPVTGDQEAIATRVDALAAELRRPVSYDGVQLAITCSVGYCTAPQAGIDSQELYHAADLAMYQAKRAGGGRAIAYSPTMAADTEREREARAAAWRGMAEDRLSLAYQPILDLRRGGVWGYEALLRLQLDDGTSVPAGDFLPVLLAGGEGHAVGTVVLDQLAADLPALLRPPGVRVAFNLSAAELRDVELVHRLLGGDLAAYATRLVVEVTEETLAVPGVTEILSELKQRGVMVAVDDFGSGRASVALLVQAGPAVIKVDREFTACLSQHGAAVIRSAVNLAHGLHSVVVAEGVETSEQESALPRLGVHLGQGYSLGRPLAPVRPAL